MSDSLKETLSLSINTPGELVPEAALRRVRLHPESARPLRREHPREDRAGALRGGRLCLLRPHPGLEPQPNPAQHSQVSQQETDMAR